MHIKARLVRVGNSRGVQLPKPLLEEAGLPDEVEIHAEPERIIIQSAVRPRAAWAAAARQMAERGEDALIDAPIPTGLTLKSGRGRRLPHDPSAWGTVGY